MTEVYRVQDKDGRGPYKPGFSHKWTDHDGGALPTIFEEFPNLDSLWRPNGSHGCAFVSLDQANAWFSPPERRRLRHFGFRLHALDAEIIGTGKHQLLIWSEKPFSKIARPMRWPELQPA